MRKKEFTIDEMLYMTALLNGLYPVDPIDVEHLVVNIESDATSSEFYKKYNVERNVLIQKLRELDRERVVNLIMNIHLAWRRDDYQWTLLPSIIQILYYINGFDSVKVIELNLKQKQTYAVYIASDEEADGYDLSDVRFRRSVLEMPMVIRKAG